MIEGWGTRTQYATSWTRRSGLVLSSTMLDDPSERMKEVKTNCQEVESVSIVLLLNSLASSG